MVRALLVVMLAVGGAGVAFAKKPYLGDRYPPRPTRSSSNGLISLQVSGALSSSTVRPKLSPLASKFRACAPGKEWGFALSFSIMSDGQVVAAKLTGIRDDQVRACARVVVDAVKSTRFESGFRPTAVETRWRFGYKPKPPPVAKCQYDMCIDRVRVGSKRLDLEDVKRSFGNRRSYLRNCIHVAKQRYTASISSDRFGKITRVVVRGKDKNVRRCLERNLDDVALPSTMKRERVSLRLWREKVYGGVVGGVVGGRSRLRIDSLTTSGSLNASVVRRFLRRTMPRLQQCIGSTKTYSTYGRRRRPRRPPRRARYRIRMDVSASGRVTLATVTGGIGGPCMRTALRGLRFPRHRKKSTIRATFRYAP